MTPRPRRLALALTTGAAIAAMAWPALGQSTPPLSSMPPPPSASDAAPREKATSPKARAQPRKAQGRKAGNPDEITFADPSEKPTRARRGGASTTQSFERPQRYVPEEFDRGRGGGGVEPFVSQGGRPGMGMRF